MKTVVKELTEGMQRLCAVANRVVAAEGQVAPIERDLLLENLRRLYEVALRLGAAEAAEAPTAEAAGEEEELPMVTDSDMLSSAMMATMAAMTHHEGEGLTENGERRTENLVGTENGERRTENWAAAVDMESVEGNPNGILFEEEEEEAVAEPVVIEAEPEPVVVEPKPVAVEPEPEPVAVEPEPVAVEPEPEPEPVRAQTSLLDYLKRPSEGQTVGMTLGERLGSHTPTANSRKVDDLRTVININDKYSFMNDLFKGNLRVYNDFILQLNDIGGREEALAAVAEVAQQYGWDMESATVKAFYKVFDKKF